MTGILYPAPNDTITTDERFCNHNIDPIRILPLSLYDRISMLSATERHSLFPDTGGRAIIRSRSPNKIQAWICNTSYMQRKYDRWYWNMRLNRIPFTVAFRAPLKTVKSNIQRKVHFRQVDNAIERNRRLLGPPRWLEEEYRC